MTAADVAISPPPPARQSIRFRARSFIAFALAPELPIADWLAELDVWTASSPGFFVGRPVILELAATALDAAGIANLISELAGRGIRIMGIEGATPGQLGPELPPLLTGGRPAVAASIDAPPAQAAVVEPVREEPTSLLIDKPVRSGQSVIFPHGDVVVVGSVASGAEVIAGGSIHIHGALRGRAMAGATSKPGARIFCTKNEAELFAVDGYYQTAEDMDPKLRGHPVQAFLEDGVLLVAALD